MATECRPPGRGRPATSIYIDRNGHAPGDPASGGDVAILEHAAAGEFGAENFLIAGFSTDVQPAFEAML